MTTILFPVPAPSARAETESAAPLTPEDMLRLPDDGRLYELVEGKLVEKEMSDIAQLVANLVNDELVIWAKRTGAGRSFVETTFQCFPHAPGMVRRPDVSFISRQRLTGYEWGRGHFTVVPDLAVEVISPHDEVLELDRKLADYFRAGVRRVWVINPELEILRIHRGLGDVSELVGGAELTDPDVLPGFSVHLPALFARPGVPAV